MVGLELMCSAPSPAPNVPPRPPLNKPLPILLANGIIASGPRSAINPMCGVVKIPPNACGLTSGGTPVGNIGGCQPAILALKAVNEPAAELAAPEILPKAGAALLAAVVTLLTAAAFS